MPDLWAPDSLRGRHLKLKTESKLFNNPPIIEGGFLANFKNVVEHSKKQKELKKETNNFICPNCLKSVIFDELLFECPFCNERYGELKKRAEEIKPETLIDVLGKAMMYRRNDLEKEKALFDKCDKCDAKIRYVTCYHCNKPIDLFASYNEEELEAKRYV